jgi:hypothetical protein
MSPVNKKKTLSGTYHAFFIMDVNFNYTEGEQFRVVEVGTLKESAVSK